MPYRGIWALLLAVMLLAPGLVLGVEEKQPAQENPAEQKPPQIKSQSEEFKEIQQKVLNPKKKKLPKPSKVKSTGINRSTGGNWVSHETKCRVDNKDYEKKYKKMMKEVQKKNEEKIKAFEEQKKQKTNK